jgi:asparagine synthase (glutamine-hydrolysing)
MCGIAGYVGEKEIFQSQLLREQANSLRHRGPDSEGFYTNDSVGLAFCRLSIIDVESGSQPCFSEDGDIVSIFNGEIYNFIELRSHLVTKGHKINSIGDSEIIPHLYEEYGIDFLNQLEGMFAIALWDKRKETLYLVRDRFGEKPLWFEVFGENILFASEVKALLQYKHARKLDYQGIFSNLMFGYSGVKQSCIEGIRMVPPSSFLSFHKGVVELREYWSPKSVDLGFKDINQATDYLEDLLIESIRGRLISERPLGIFLSGGIDSSIIAALTAKLLDEPVKTFSLGFEEKEFDESNRAARTARLLGAEHHQTELKMEANWVIAELPKILDYPFSDSSFMPTYFLSKFAAEKVTVALSGDGGDEGFGGYDRYRLNRYLHLLTRDRLSFSKLDELMVSQRRASKLVRSMEFSDAIRRYVSLTELISARLMRRMLKDDFVNEYEPLFYTQYELRDELKNLSILESMQRHDLRNYLPGDLMFKVDYASMAHGLEVRTPFLSHKVVEFGLSLSDSFKIGARQNKLILRNLAGRYYDQDLLKLRKKGFAIPKAKWLREELNSQISNLLLDSGSFIQTFCKREFIQLLIDDHKKGAEREEIIWPLLILELWHQEWTKTG